ncbi:MAG: glycosidase, partial [Crenarchaeota archaeon]|nr:glycosidase [Thermoproteota archaeon]
MVFDKCPNADAACEVREFKSVDVVRRLGVIPPNHIHLKNYPI